LLRRSDLHKKKNSHIRIVLITLHFLKPKTIHNCGLDSIILTLTFLRGKWDEKLYRLNLALILIGQFMWAEQKKSYNGNTIVISDIQTIILTC
jgi:hypothetical protein